MTIRLYFVERSPIRNIENSEKEKNPSLSILTPILPKTSCSLVLQMLGVQGSN